MLTTPFLTALDDRARVKGSRDPLGLQAVWARFGRHVVGNLTTVTGSLRDFTVLLLGADLVERVAAEDGPGAELETFLRWEQLAAYARVGVNEEPGVRGTVRVRRFQEAGRQRVTLSAAPAHQILGNQASYGVWGLYMAAARASALLEPDAVRLTPAARGLVETDYHRRLAEHGAPVDALVRLLRKSAASLVLDGRDRGLVAAVADVLRTEVGSGEVEVYRRHLLEGGPADPTAGKQAALTRLLDDVPGDEPLSPRLLERLERQARAEDREDLADRLARIRACESLLVPIAAMFGRVLASEGQTIPEAAAPVREAWGRVRTIDLAAVRALRAELGGSDAAAGDRFVAVAEALVAGAYERVLALLLEQNAAVMAARGGAQWVVVERGALRVRAQDETIPLPTRAELEVAWRFPYFLNSLRAIAASLKRVRRRQVRR